MINPSKSRAYREITQWMLRAGIVRTTITLTSLTAVLAIVAHGSILALTVGHDVPLRGWLIASVLVPVLITPPVSWILMSLTYELSAAKTALAEAALTDALTQVPNRRAFLVQAEIELARHRRLTAPFAVLMLDIDHFKSVNDSLGHRVGDMVLRAIADGCTATLRRGDIFARYGGEEFVVLLPITGHHDAAGVAEKLRAAVAALDLKPFGVRRPITASIGVGIYSTQAAGLQSVLDEADRQLYVAKRAGRNCVRMETPPRLRRAS